MPDSAVSKGNSGMEGGQNSSPKRVRSIALIEHLFQVTYEQAAA